MVRMRSRSRGRSLSTSSSSTSSIVESSSATALHDKNDNSKTNDNVGDVVVAELESNETPEAVVQPEYPLLEAVDNHNDNDNEDDNDGAVETQESVVEKEIMEGDKDDDDRDNDEQEDLIELTTTLASSRQDIPSAATGTLKGKHVWGRSTSKGRSAATNTLTDLIPGYTAPMALDSSSLDKFRPTGGIRALQRRAEQTDVSTTRSFVATTTTGSATQLAVNAVKRTRRRGTLPQSSYTASYSSFKMGTKKTPDTSAGGGWFGMKPSAMTEELKTDLAVIRNRSYLDPKRFYKSSDKHHAIVQLGTVIEGPTEYHSSRLTKKQRRSNLTEELMADPATADYARRKFQDVSREKSQQADLRKRRKSYKGNNNNNNNNNNNKGSRKFY